jgi:P27 family predicted phage terminase small subunit
LRIIRGNPRKHPINTAEPQAPPSPADPPPDLEGEALRMWNETAPKLIAAGLLTTLDREMWTRYCITWELWKRNKTLVLKHGDLIKHASGHVAQSPAYIQYKSLGAELSRIEQQFGMTPASRSQVVLQSNPADDPFDSFVKGRGTG